MPQRIVQSNTASRDARRKTARLVRKSTVFAKIRKKTNIQADVQADLRKSRFLCFGSEECRETCIVWRRIWPLLGCFLVCFSLSFGREAVVSQVRDTRSAAVARLLRSCGTAGTEHSSANRQSQDAAHASSRHKSTNAAVKTFFPPFDVQYPLFLLTLHFKIQTTC